MIPLLTHYGPVYVPVRKAGETFALCRNNSRTSTLSTNWDWVTCEDCKKLMPPKGKNACTG